MRELQTVHKIQPINLRYLPKSAIFQRKWLITNMLKKERNINNSEIRFIKFSFHLQQTPRPRHKKQSNYVVEQSSFPPNRFVSAQNWSLSWSKMDRWKPGSSRFTMNNIAPKLQKCWTYEIAFKMI